MKFQDIDTRTSPSQNRKGKPLDIWITKSDLWDLYVVRRLSIEVIGRRYGKSYRQVRKRMSECGIEPWRNRTDPTSNAAARRRQER